ncbi:hypothetical protein EJB05_11845, partial [Eragrostis curvula]
MLIQQPGRWTASIRSSGSQSQGVTSQSQSHSPVVSPVGHLIRSTDGSYSKFPDLAVCDPLSRRYRMLPPIPDALRASIQVHEIGVKCFDAFIVPSGDEEEDTTFRVIGVVQCLDKLDVFIYSSSTDNWYVSGSTTWEALSLTVPQQGRVLGYGPSYFAYGCFYKKVFEKNKLLKFNMSSTEFSTVDLPPRHDKMKIVVVEAGQGRLGVFSQINAQMLRYSFGKMTTTRLNSHRSSGASVCCAAVVDVELGDDAGGIDVLAEAGLSERLIASFIHVAEWSEPLTPVLTISKVKNVILIQRPGGWTDNLD